MEFIQILKGLGVNCERFWLSLAASVVARSPALNIFANVVRELQIFTSFNFASHIIMRAFTDTITNTTLGTAHIPSYPDKQNNEILYSVPLYRVYVEGRDAANNLVQEDFEAIRFGVHKTASSQARVVGLAEAQTHTLSWNDISTMPGDAQRVYEGFSIHEAPYWPLNRV